MNGGLEVKVLLITLPGGRAAGLDGPSVVVISPNSDVDSFRIKIRDKDSCEAVVYDNEMSDGVVGRAGWSDVVPADGEAHPGESWGQQSAATSPTSASMSQTEDASGRDDAPVGWEQS